MEKVRRTNYLDWPLTGAGVVVCLWMEHLERIGVDIPDEALVNLVESIEEYVEEIRGEGHNAKVSEGE